MAVQAASHFGMAYVATAAVVVSRLIGVCHNLRCTHSTHFSNKAGLPRFFNVRFGFIGFRPLHLGSFFILSPPQTSSFLFLFMSFCLTFLSFICAHNGPAFSTFEHNLPSTQVSGRPGDNEVGFIGCPCALVFPFIAATHTFVASRPPSHVFTFLSMLRAHMHIS